MRVAAEIELSGKDREQLGKWAAARSAPVRLRERAPDRPAGRGGHDEQGDRVGAGDRCEQGGPLAGAGRRGGRVGDREGTSSRREPGRQGQPGAGGTAQQGDRGDHADDAGGTPRTGRAGRWRGIWRRRTAS